MDCDHVKRYCTDTPGRPSHCRCGYVQWLRDCATRWERAEVYGSTAYVEKMRASYTAQATRLRAQADRMERGEEG